MSGKRKNPIYVVKEKGDVIPTKSWFEALIEKFDLAPVLSFLQQFWDFLLVKLSQVNSYAWFVEIKKIFDFMVQKLTEFGFLPQENQIRTSPAN